MPPRRGRTFCAATRVSVMARRDGQEQPHGYLLHGMQSRTLATISLVITGLERNRHVGILQSEIKVTILEVGG